MTGIFALDPRANHTFPPPPVCPRPVISLKGIGRRPDKSHFLRPPKLVLDGEFYSNRRRTNVQQLTCNIDLSRSFYYLFFSFVLLEPKPFVLKGKVLGGKV